MSIIHKVEQYISAVIHIYSHLYTLDKGNDFKSATRFLNLQILNFSYLQTNFT